MTLMKQSEVKGASDIQEGRYKVRKIIFFIGVALMAIGIGIIAWFFIQNNKSEQEMLKFTVEFMETLEEPVPEKILEGDTIGVLEFPVFGNEKIAIKEGVSNSVLNVAAGHMPETEEIWDDSGNCAIAAHNNTFFKNVAKFKVNDKIIVYTRQGIYEYTVFNIETIKPDDFSILDDFPNQKVLTLITCDFTGANREIVQASGGVKIAEPKDI